MYIQIIWIRQVLVIDQFKHTIINIRVIFIWNLNIIQYVVYLNADEYSIIQNLN